MNGKVFADKICLNIHTRMDERKILKFHVRVIPDEVHFPEKSI